MEDHIGIHGFDRIIKKSDYSLCSNVLMNSFSKVC